MNTEAKRAISERFKAACEREGLNYSEAARLLGLKNSVYGPHISNEKSFNKASNEAWETVKAWTNSGETLRKYGAKHGNNEKPEKETVPERPDQKPDPPIDHGSLIGLRKNKNEDGSLIHEGKSEIPINKVTTTYLDIALRMCGINLEIAVIDKIIDLVELIEQKGGEVSIEDICKLQADWN